ncbi:MAG: hypothetical protein LN413_00350, partial [Candidatus Thermoplasmatota archaeon]|nr:hypothetical protein [Candidatus Thermoplasmatota archaeon]
PQALEGRQLMVRLVTTTGVHVVVDRWSWVKVQAMVKLVFEVFRQKSDQEMSEILEGEVVDIASNVFDLLGDRVFVVIRESVRPEDRKHITPEMDAEDVLNLLDATLQVNEGFIASIKKKGPAILRQFGLDSLLKKTAVKVRK